MLGSTGKGAKEPNHRWLKLSGAKGDRQRFSTWLVASDSNQVASAFKAYPSLSSDKRRSR